MNKLTTTIGINYNGAPITERQIRILRLISEKKSQNKVAELLSIPPSAVNIQIKRLEKKLGVQLIYSSTYGTILTETAQEIVKYYELRKKRISSDKFIGCGYISGEIGKILFDNIIISSFDNILKLYKMDLLSIIGIDDPYWSMDFGVSKFQRSFYDPIPVAYDYFIKVHSPKYEFNHNNLIGIRYSPQRIIWNILKSENITHKITKTVKNPFYALDLVEKGYSLYINKCFEQYIKKEYIVEKPYFYDKTKHTINIIPLYDENNKNVEHKNIEEIIFKKKKELKNKGFELVDYY
ncbi:helix-turn-helix domain-containing protein [Methanococcus aeolicus]|uniref:Transcriptional regulator, LysR family n=1 Tax=Methanococcus aeolicus (strain ATCC BAA-1280 / DSM 17508 / OCM 812 / Nankai-3) TaxID=419665 RepID=A6UW88_META3|nr:LysR family transcriptional regulator [Methanococcus aeolicus]ABR56760.1 transcriptional regulator, LysR family [Methanococcus aeolicus Nankai-3]UXM84760.1 LysR family transcriptional regulator [Methanococcus aeolicus]